MNYKEFTKKSYGLEAKEVPPKPMTYSDIKEELEEGILSKAIANKLILRKIKSIKWDDLAKMIKNGLLDGVDNIDDLDTKALHVALRNVNIKIKEEIEEGTFQSKKDITVQYSYTRNPKLFMQTLLHTKTGKKLKSVYPYDKSKIDSILTKRKFHLLKGTGQDHIDFLKTLNSKGIMPNNKIIGEELEEDIRIYDETGNKKAEAKAYIDVYKDTHRGAPKIKDERGKFFTLSGKDERLVADMVQKKGRFKEGNNE